MTLSFWRLSHVKASAPECQVKRHKYRNFARDETCFLRTATYTLGMNNESDPILVELCRRLEEHNALLTRQLAYAQNWRIILRNGIIAGLGGVLGATLVVSVLMGVLRPLQGLDRLGPILERLEQDIKKR